jgi:hypothetical protein
MTIGVLLGLRQPTYSLIGDTADSDHTLLKRYYATTVHSRNFPRRNTFTSMFLTVLFQLQTLATWILTDAFERRWSSSISGYHPRIELYELRNTTKTSVRKTNHPSEIQPSQRQVYSSAATPTGSVQCDLLPLRLWILMWGLQSHAYYILFLLSTTVRQL